MKKKRNHDICGVHLNGCLKYILFLEKNQINLAQVLFLNLSEHALLNRINSEKVTTSFKRYVILIL